MLFGDTLHQENAQVYQVQREYSGIETPETKYMCIGIAKYCESVMKDSAKKSEYSEVDQSDEIVINVKKPLQAK